MRLFGIRHSLQAIREKLRINYELICNSVGMGKSSHLIERIDIIREKIVWEIQRDLKCIIDESHRVYTDTKGSFYDDRYTHLTYMEAMV